MYMYEIIKWYDANFYKDIKINFAMDGFHFSQALKQLTTNEYQDVYEALYEMVLFNKKKEFKIMCNDFKALEPQRIETIDNNFKQLESKAIISKESIYEVFHGISHFSYIRRYIYFLTQSLF